MSNKYTTKINSKLLLNKLARAMTKVQSSTNPTGTNTNLITHEQAANEAYKKISKFYKKMGEAQFTPEKVYPNTAPDYEIYNQNLEEIDDDLNVLFSEMENLETAVLESFNYMVSRLTRLNGRLKNVSSQLGDYILYSTWPSKDAVFFSDSFNNLSRIEAHSPLLNEEECAVNQEEGIITLPVDRAAQETITIRELPAINDNSNGTVGNNYEEGAAFNGSISVILDNNPDTWFEYERVVTKDDGEALILDFTVNLGEEKIINFVRINPNNFGTRTQIGVIAIDTSADGKTFVSIKDDIPIAGWVAQDEENVFTLAPSTSKFAGQGLYTFTPRKAKYIRFSLKQITPYLISTSTGTKFRYAIGVRDVEVSALPYKEKGEIISTSFASADEIKKVVLLSSQNPDPATLSKLASVKHYVSPDNGITWYEIRPKVSAGVADITQTIPELLDFNGVGENTISTSSPVKSLRYKAVLERNSDAFTEDSAELAQSTSPTTELHLSPATTPFDLKPQKTPIDGTLKVVDVNYGSRGFEDNKYFVAVGTGNKLSLKLPFPIKRDYPLEKPLGSVVFFGGVGSANAYRTSTESPETVYIDGEEWDPDLSPSSTSSGTHYYLDNEQGVLEFGDNVQGKAPPAGAIVSIVLQEERLFPSIGTDHIAMLDYATVADQEQVEINIILPMQQKTVLLEPGQIRHILEPYITTDPISYSNRTVFNTQKQHPNEVLTAGDFYLNRETGLLLSYTATPYDSKTTVGFYYSPRRKLDNSAWSFANYDGGVANAVSITEDAYQTFEVSTSNPEPVPALVNYFAVHNTAVVPGSLQLVTSSGIIASGVYGEEVSYVDGRTELLGVIQTTQAISSITGVSGDTNVDKIFDLPISSDTALEVLFENTAIFVTDVTPAAPSAVGEYSINRSNRTFTIRVDKDYADPGDVTYYYDNPRANLTGRYSVNYKAGDVFLHDKTGAGDEIAYEYTDYRIKYPIVREVNTKDWSYDKSLNTVTIKDREILKNMRQPMAPGPGIGSTSKYYQLSYDYVDQGRQDIEELVDYFSPVLKDYALKIITASRLV